MAIIGGVTQAAAMFITMVHATVAHLLLCRMRALASREGTHDD